MLFSFLRSIRARLVLLVLISVIPALGIIVYAGLEGRRTAIINAENDALMALSSLALEQERTLEGTRALLMALSKVQEVRSLNVNGSTRLFKSLLEQNPIYASIFMADAQGTIISSAIPFIPGHVKERKVFLDCIRTKDFSVGEYAIGTTTKRPVLHFGYPVLDSKGRLKGVVIAAVGLAHYGKIFLKAKLPKDSVMSIVDHRGVRFFRYPDPEEFIGKEFELDSMSKMTEGPEQGMLRMVGHEHRGVYRKFSLTENGPPYMFIVLRISEKETLRQAGKVLSTSLILMFIAFCIAVLCAVLIGNVTIVKRLGRLVFASKELARGDLGVRTGLGHIGGELGELARTFDEMAEGLEQEDLGRRQAEEALRQSEEQYRRIFENATEGIFQTIQTVPGGRFISVNPAMARMYGYASPEEMKAEIVNIEEQLYVNPAERKEYERQLHEVGVVTNFESASYRRDGSVIWVRLNVRAVKGVDGTLLYYEGIAEDITSRKQAEESLRESEEKYRAIFENAVMGISQSTPDGGYLAINPAQARMYGYDSPEEMIRSVTDIAHQLYVDPDERKRFKKLMDAYGHVEGIESERYRKDGSTFWVSINSRSVRDLDGKILYYEGTIEDITSRKRAEEDRTRLESQLRQSQKMEAVGTLAGGIAHDFNNILTVMTGYGTLLQMQMDAASPLRIYVDQILSASQKAASLTQSLLAFSRQQPITLRPVDLNDVVRGTEKLLNRLLTEDIALQTDFFPEAIIVMADATQIDQILFNLATNARDAMPKGGTLFIETKLIELDRSDPRVPEFIRPGKYALLSVSDTGTGMDEATREHIFDPFFTTKEVGKGTGLGLSTVYGVVKQHNGYIIVNSERERGTVFKIYLPIVRAIVAEEKPSPAHIQGGTETILIAEDSESVRLLIKEVLTGYGYTPIEAIDGEDAVLKFNLHRDIDLLIIDSVMPKKNGREVYDEIGQMSPNIKVLFISGYTKDVILDKGIEEKLLDFLSKPIMPDDLLRKVREVLDR